MAAEKKKAAVKKKPATKRSTCYDVSGGSLKRKNKSCPKCGPGIFMAQHKNRVTCGKCGYMEKVAKSE